MVSGPGNHERKMSGNILIGLDYLGLEFIDFSGVMSNFKTFFGQFNSGTFICILIIKSTYISYYLNIDMYTMYLFVSMIIDEILIPIQGKSARPLEILVVYST